MTDETIGSERNWVLLRGDPLLWLLAGKLKLSTPLILLLMVTLNAISIFGVGTVLSYVTHQSVPIIRTFDHEHLYFGLLVVFVYVPVVWLVYTWQPKGVADTLGSLARNEVIPETENREFEVLSETMCASVNHSSLPIAVTLVVLALLSIQTLFVFPSETLRLGRPYFWFYDKYYYYLLYTPVMFLSYYATAMVVLKGVFTLAWFNRLFRKLRVRVYPLHPDGAGGLGAIGGLATKYGLLGIAIGAMATSLTVARVIIGSGWAYPDAFTYYTLYAIITPLALFVPMWSAHRSMVRARDHLLLEISVEFEMMLNERDLSSDEPLPEVFSIELFGFEAILRRKRCTGGGEPSGVGRRSGRLEELQARYRLIKRDGPGLADYDLITSWSRKSVTRSDTTRKSQNQSSRVVTR